MAIDVTTDSFESFVKDNKVALLDFSATWCGPCQVIKPVLDQLSQDYEDRAAVGVVDIDREPALAAAFRVSAVPTLVFFKDGEPVGAVQGAVERRVLSQQLDKLLAE